MAVSFQLLESKLMQEINNIKIMIAQLKDPQFNPHQYFHPPNPIYYPIPHKNIRPIPQYLSRQPPPIPPQQTTSRENIFISKTTTALPVISSSIPTTTTEKNKEMIIDFKPIIFPTTPSPPVKTTTTTQPELKPYPPKTKSLPSKHKLRSGPRDFEVHRFNNTIMSGGEVQIFTYFWKIDNFTTKLKNNLTEIISPIFTISGLHLRVKAILNYLNRDLLYLQIESVSLDVFSNSSNIILETGNLFQEIETKKLFRHKIIILDQASAEQTDLISQEFLNTNSGFMIPNSAISSSSYSKDDSILIKIIIYL